MEADEDAESGNMAGALFGKTHKVAANGNSGIPGPEYFTYDLQAAKHSRPSSASLGWPNAGRGNLRRSHARYATAKGEGRGQKGFEGWGWASGGMPLWPDFWSVLGRHCVRHVQPRVQDYGAILPCQRKRRLGNMIKCDVVQPERTFT